MKKFVLAGLGLLAIAAGAAAQTPDEAIERALAPTTPQQKDAVTVIKWKADGTYDTLKKGTGQLVCYDRSNELGRTGFNVQCTVLGNLPRVRRRTASSRRSATKPRVRQRSTRPRKTARRARRKAGLRLAVDRHERHGQGTRARIHPDRSPSRVRRRRPPVCRPTARHGGAWIMDAGTTTAHIMIPGT